MVCKFLAKSKDVLKHLLKSTGAARGPQNLDELYAVTATGEMKTWISLPRGVEVKMSPDS